MTEYNSWQEWANGHCRMVYPPTCEEAKRHTSGWAMRNTNNHNVHILKKSCLGVLVCSLRCVLPNGDEVNQKLMVRNLGREITRLVTLDCFRRSTVPNFTSFNSKPVTAEQTIEPVVKGTMHRKQVSTQVPL